MAASAALRCLVSRSSSSSRSDTSCREQRFAPPAAGEGKGGRDTRGAPQEPLHLIVASANLCSRGRNSGEGGGACEVSGEGCLCL